MLLCGSEGRVLLTDQAHSVLYSVNWNRLLIPNLMLWISNGGRQSRPWNGNNFCIGIEPVVSAFDLGTYASRSPNPLANQGVETVRRFLPQKPETFSIEIAAQSI